MTDLTTLPSMAKAFATDAHEKDDKTMSEWQPIDTAPQDGTMIIGKEGFVPEWPSSGRTRYRIWPTQWVQGEGWIYYTKRGDGAKWAPTKRKKRAGSRSRA